MNIPNEILNMDVSENTEQQTTQVIEVINVLTKQLQAVVLYCYFMLIDSALCIIFMFHFLIHPHVKTII